jgi:hypothetical protein
MFPLSFVWLCEKIHRLVGLLNKETPRRKLGCNKDEEEVGTRCVSCRAPHCPEDSKINGAVRARHVFVVRDGEREMHKGERNHYTNREGTGRITLMYTLRKYVVRMWIVFKLF